MDARSGTGQRPRLRKARDKNAVIVKSITPSEKLNSKLSISAIQKTILPVSFILLVCFVLIS